MNATRHGKIPYDIFILSVDCELGQKDTCIEEINKILDRHIIDKTRGLRRALSATLEVVDMLEDDLK